MVDVPLSGVGSTAAVGEFLGYAPKTVTYDMYVTVLDPELDVAPTAVTVTLTGGIPDAAVTFDIDGTPAYTITTDSLGGLGPTSVPVSDAYGAGTHTITATQTGATSASGTFVLARDPSMSPASRGLDADPVDVPGAVVGNVRRWVLQDLMPGGLGSYIMENNPSRMTPPHVHRALTPEHTTSRAGQFHVFEAGPAPQEWQISGYCPTQAMHDKLLAYGALNRRFYVIDHRNRAWVVTFLDVDLVARRRQTPRGGLPTDWGHDYTITAVVYDQTARMP